MRIPLQDHLSFKLAYRLECFLYSELRDQGLTRPKVVILVPFRDAALKVVEALMQLICPGDGVRYRYQAAC